MPPSYFLKLAWADQQLHTLFTQIDWWVANEPYAVTEETDPQTGYITLSAEPRGDPPLDLALRIGDFVHNLRTGLDHLALALAERNMGGPLSDKDEAASQFPIYSTRKRWKDGYRGRIGCVHPKAQAAIKRLQPYRACNVAERAGRITPSGGECREWGKHPLWRLRELSDFDKHRRLSLMSIHAGLSAQIGAGQSAVSIGYLYLHTTGGPLERKTPLLTWDPASMLNPQTGAKVDVDRHVALSVGFGDQAPQILRRTDVRKELAGILLYVTHQVRPALEPFLQ